MTGWMGDVYPWVRLFLLVVIAINTFNIETTVDRILRRVTWIDVDHIVPLECGGADVPSNIQWQTKEVAALKDRGEVRCRQ